MAKSLLRKRKAMAKRLLRSREALSRFEKHRFYNALRRPCRLFATASRGCKPLFASNN